MNNCEFNRLAVWSDANVTVSEAVVCALVYVCGVSNVTTVSPPTVAVVAVSKLHTKFSEETPLTSALELTAVLTAVNSVLKSTPDITLLASD